MHCAADDNDYSDNDIICISFTASAFKRQDTIDNISIGGITFESTEAEINQMFGEPTDNHEDSSHFSSYLYLIDKKWLTLSFNYGHLNIIDLNFGENKTSINIDTSFEIILKLDNDMTKVEETMIKLSDEETYTVDGFCEI